MHYGSVKVPSGLDKINRVYVLCFNREARAAYTVIFLYICVNMTAEHGLTLLTVSY